MHARAYVAESYVGDVTMPHVGHTWPFKVLVVARYFCLRVCPHMHGTGIQKYQPCRLAKIITFHPFVYYKNLGSLGSLIGGNGVSSCFL